jgi:predicted RNA-binding Zn-ribbon protein involved in translation (DUF1610 family)
MNSEKHMVLPKDTKAFICANCGAVSLDPNEICNVQGQGVKSDWCGTKSMNPPSFCRNRKNNNRYKCAKCGQVAVNPGLLCEPEKMQIPD